MKVLAISHSCVADVNQQLFVALRQLPEVAGLEMIIPATWRSEYTGRLHPPTILPAVDFPVHSLPVFAPGNVSLHCYKTLPMRRLRQFRPDVVLSTQEPWSLSNLQAIWLSGTLRAPLVFQTNQNIFKHYPPPFSWLERLSYSSAAVALAYSEEARQVMLRKGLRKPSLVVPYGTDIAMFTPGVSLMRERLGLGNGFVIGYMGRLVPEKGLDTLIRSLPRVLQGVPGVDVRLLMVGSGSEEAALKKVAVDLGVAERVVFAGSVPHREANDSLRCMDVFALPSRTMSNWKEQFGRVIIEALACEVPVIGSDSGQIPHLIRDTGGGLVFPEGDADALAVQLLTLIRDPVRRHQLAQAGSEAVRERYTYAAVAQQLYAVFCSVLRSEHAHESSEELAAELSRP